jgi:hypothetical protein
MLLEYFRRKRRIAQRLTLRHSIEEFPDQPQMTERIGHSTLQHLSDGPRSFGVVLVFRNWTVLFGTSRNRSPLNRRRIIHE